MNHAMTVITRVLIVQHLTDQTDLTAFRIITIQARAIIHVLIMTDPHAITAAMADVVHSRFSRAPKGAFFSIYLKAMRASRKVLA